jgi:protein-S-isoprenylcysteine O-methyltransferase
MAWSIGSQLLLCNPLCTLGFAATTWRFFSHRVAYEDMQLQRFFGAAFRQYKAAVPSGIPFIP